METMKSVFLLILLSALTLAFAFLACGDDDDDDDDDAVVDDDDSEDDDDAADDDDDATDDDAVDDDDDDDDHECEELYDVIVEGTTTFDEKAKSAWTAKLTINTSGTLTGVIVPSEEDIDQYGVSGFRYSATEGYLQGTFPTPESMAAACAEETLGNHIDMIFDGTTMTGDVILYCGTIEEGNEILYGDATGTVTCGDFGI